MGLNILGMGTANPDNIMTQPEATEAGQTICCQTSEQAAILKVLYRRAGVKKRHTTLTFPTLYSWANLGTNGDSGVGTAVATLGASTAERMRLYVEAASPLALRASADAMVHAEITPEEITHVVTVSCTGFSAPGVDIDLINGLGLKPTVERTHVGFMSCHGALNGVRVTRAITESQPDARVLLCAVELCSLHYRMQWDPIKFIGNAIFADGAAALVAGGGEPTDEDSWRAVANGSCLIPDSADGIRWNLGDHGFEIDLSPRVPDLIKQHLRPWLESWLSANGLGLSDVASWAVHPGGPRILGSVEESLGLTSEATTVSREVLAEFGNMSSPTVLYIVDRLRARGAARPCVALAFGPGLMAEAVLFR